MKVEGPFVDWPPNLLEEVMEALYAKRSGLKHLIHLVIQPHMTSFSIKVNGSPFQTITLLTERCAQSLKSLNFTHNTQMATHHFSNFFSHLKNLTRLNVNGSVVDDGCFRVIGENCDKLIELDAGDTYISNVGLTYLSFDELMPVMQCLPGLQIYRYYFKLVQGTCNTKVEFIYPVLHLMYVLLKSYAAIVKQWPF